VFNPWLKKTSPASRPSRDTNLQRRRRDIFVELNQKRFSSSVGATYSETIHLQADNEKLPEYAAPNGAWHFSGFGFYKDAAPDGA